MAKYIVKQRDYLGMGRPSSRRPQGSMRFSKWRRHCDYATQAEASQAMAALKVDARLAAIFHKGKRVAGGELRVVF